MLLRIIGSLGTGEVTEKHAVSWQRTQSAGRHAKQNTGPVM